MGNVHRGGAEDAEKKTEGSQAGAAMREQAIHRDRINCRQFIGVLRRRLWFIRAVESVGVCVVIASAVGALAAGVIRFATGTVSPIDALWVAWAIALGIGLVVAWRRRPTLLHVAMEVDRQLDLHELLSSVLACDGGKQADAPWHAALVAAADARCREITPGQIVLNRLGARSWGGIGLAMALSLVVTLMLAGTDPRSSITSAMADGHTNIGGQVNPRQESMVNSSNPQRPDIEQQSQHFSGESDVTDRTTSPTATLGADAHDSNTTAAAASGAGGLGRTQENPQPPPVQSSTNSIGESHQTGTLAGGGAGNSIQSNGKTDAASGAAATSDRNTSAPWESSTWSSDRAAALQATDNGSIPDAYRGMVRDYFQR